MWMNVEVPFIGVCILCAYLHFRYYTIHCLFLQPISTLCDFFAYYFFLAISLPYSDTLEQPHILLHRQYIENKTKKQKLPGYN